jgi:SsrA-binding protein
MAAPNKKTGEQAERYKSIVINRRARHEYHFEEVFEAGIVLTGTEVKSLRSGRVSIVDAYGVVENAEVWLKNLNISPWEKGNRFNHDPLRPRKLLLHREEIRRLIGKTREKGLTLIPTRMYFQNGRVKVELAVARGKKLYDKREAEAERTAKREMERAVRVSVKDRE